MKTILTLTYAELVRFRTYLEKLRKNGINIHYAYLRGIDEAIYYRIHKLPPKNDEDEALFQGLYKLGEDLNFITERKNKLELNPLKS